jgi:hypothetical protein
MPPWTDFCGGNGHLLKLKKIGVVLKAVGVYCCRCAPMSRGGAFDKL